MTAQVISQRLGKPAPQAADLSVADGSRPAHRARGAFPAINGLANSMLAIVFAIVLLPANPAGRAALDYLWVTDSASRAAA
jgi:hypothetical protein